MPKLKPGTRVPTLKEDAAINAGIKADRDNPEWIDADFARAKPAAEFFDAKAMAALVTLKRRPGERGPQKTPTKERISIRLSHDVVETFRASGEGWQTRIDDALRDYVAKRSVTPRAPVRRQSARAARAR